MHRHLATLPAILALLLLAACGPTEQEVAAARERITEAETLHAQTLAHLDAFELRQAADTYAELHALTRATTIAAVEIPVDGRSSLAVTEALRDDLRQTLRQRLPQLTARYLTSRATLAELDSLLLLPLQDEWENERTRMRQAATAKAAQELRLVFTGAPLPRALRDSIVQGIRSRVEEVDINLGYQLADPPPGRGTISITVDMESTTHRSPDGLPIGLVPHAIHLNLQANTVPASSWSTLRALTASAPPIEPPATGTTLQELQRRQRQQAERLAVQLREQFAVMPPLVFEST